MKRRIKEIIVVEGRYDKNALSQVVDATIVETRGFGIFRDREKAALLRRMGQEKGIIVLTDSDGAGFVIRGYLKSILPAGQLKQAYIPDVYGKEKRKRFAGREGKLGVEGMPPQVLLTALERCGATFLDGEETGGQARTPLTKADLLSLGLTGSNSTRRRKALLRALALPEHLSANSLLEVLNLLYTREELLGDDEESLFPLEWDG